MKPKSNFKKSAEMKQFCYSTGDVSSHMALVDLLVSKDEDFMVKTLKDGADTRYAVTTACDLSEKTLDSRDITGMDKSEITAADDCDATIAELKEQLAQAEARAEEAYGKAAELERKLAETVRLKEYSYGRCDRIKEQVKAIGVLINALDL